ncbi:hypothetical protein HOG98_07835 [bacterium]|mgnify:CR=1 FL=1|nr:hypothetical protein [bacterium]
MKISLIINKLIFLLLLFSSAYSADTTLVVNTDQPLADLRDSTNNYISTGTFTINNSIGGGFLIKIWSEKSGNLVKYESGEYLDDDLNGNVHNYSIEIEAVSGTLGANEPTLPTSESPGELSTTLNLTFTAKNPTENTVNKIYSFKMYTLADQSLFEGTFRDEIQFLISDL